MENVSVINTEIRTIQSFCATTESIGGLPLAREFTKYFELQHPLTLEQLLTVCQNSSFLVETMPDHHKPRGFNCEYGDKVRVLYKENDSPSGKIHTVLHELFEVMERYLPAPETNGYKKSQKDREADADQFAAYVHVPQETVWQWINTNGLDIFGLKEFMACSYASAVIRMNEVLCLGVKASTGLPTPMITLLYERPYWKKNPGGRTPRLRLNTYQKSKGFSFRLATKEIDNLEFVTPNGGNLTIQKFIRAFSQSGGDLLIPSIEMLFQTKSTIVDILIRPVHWNKSRYKHTAKVLIQIMPSDNKDLVRLAERLNIQKYDFQT